MNVSDLTKLYIDNINQKGGAIVMDLFPNGLVIVIDVVIGAFYGTAFFSSPTTPLNRTDDIQRRQRVSAGEPTREVLPGWFETQGKMYAQPRRLF